MRGNHAKHKLIVPSVSLLLLNTYMYVGKMGAVSSDQVDLFDTIRVKGSASVYQLNIMNGSLQI